MSKRRYKIGDGKLFEGVMKLLTDEKADPEGLRLLNEIMRRPEASTKLFDLMFEDLSRKTKTKPRKVRRGIGSY